MSPWKNNQLPACLTNLRPGQLAAVYGLDSSDSGKRLREMGLVEGAQVQVISDGDSMVVRVDDQRLCLGKIHADRVEVVPV